MNEQQIRIQLLGTPEVHLSGRRLVSLQTAKTEALLYYLAATRKMHRRDVLAGLFWGEMNDASARRNLTKSVSALKKMLPGFLVIRPQEIGLDFSASIELDLERFTRLSGSEAFKDRQRALDLYRGDLLDGFHLKGAHHFEEWLVVQREHYRQQLQRLLNLMALDSIAEGRLDDAGQFTRRLLELEPWDEAAHRQLMTLLARTGQFHAALIQYENCRQMLADELNAEPMPETTSLYERIKDARDQKHRPIPVHSDSFVGREPELAQIIELLSNSQVRLVTLLGIGGIGKSRLALAAASTVNAEGSLRFLNGVVFVPLTDVHSGKGMLQAVAGALRLPLRGRQPVKDELFAHLQNQEMLIVLDNVEQLLSESAQLSELLDQCADIKLLVTSREPLKIRPEWRVPLDGLSYPATERVKDEPARLLGYGSIQLFVQTARQANPDYALTADEAAGVIRVCRMLEGLPLAIKLVAMWTRVMTAERIADELQGNLDMLATELRDTPRRQQSIRAIFESTWRTLEPEVQQIFQAASIFRGGFTEEAANHVLGASAQKLAGLLDHGLLRSEPSSGRFRMHELLRQFGQEKLDQQPSVMIESADGRTSALAGDADRLADQHCAYYLGYVEKLEPALRGNLPVPALEALRRELDNIRRAWSRAVETQDYALLEASIGGLSRFYDLAGLFDEGAERFAQTAHQIVGLPAASSPSQIDFPPPILRLIIRLWVEQARLLNRRGLSSRALEVIPAAVELAAQLGDPALEAAARHEWGETLSFHGEPELSQKVLEEALNMSEEAEAPRLTSEILRHLGISMRYQGRFEEAVEMFQRALQLFRQVEDRRGESLTLNNLGILARKTGSFDEAERFYNEALRGFREIGDQWGEGIVLNNVANLLHDLGRYTEALGLCERGLVISSQIKDLWGETYLLNTQGNTMRQLGDFLNARAIYERCLRIRREIGAQLGVGATLSEIALLHHITGANDAAIAKGREALAIGTEQSSPEITAQALTTLGHAYLEMDHVQNAVASYSEALKLWEQMADRHQILEAAAGMVRVRLVQQSWKNAVEGAESLLPQLETLAVLGTAEPFRIFTTCHAALAHKKDPRANGIMFTAFRLLQSRAKMIDDRRLRNFYLNNIPAHREIIEFAEAADSYT